MDWPECVARCVAWLAIFGAAAVLCVTASWPPPRWWRKED